LQLLTYTQNPAPTTLRAISTRADAKLASVQDGRSQRARTTAVALAAAAMLALGGILVAAKVRMPAASMFEADAPAFRYVLELNAVRRCHSS